MKKSTEGIYEAIPESLATLLTAIRERIFRLQKAPFAEHLNSVRREPERATTYRTDVVGEIEGRTRIVDYEHIETYARSIGLPTCVLGFVSRYQRTSLDEAKLVAEAMLEVTEMARREGRNRLTVNDLHILAEKIDLDFPRRPELPKASDGTLSDVDAFAKQAAKTDQPDKDAQNLPLFDEKGGNT
jgi:hypothetical protein